MPKHGVWGRTNFINHVRKHIDYTVIYRPTDQASMVVYHMFFLMHIRGPRNMYNKDFNWAERKTKAGKPYIKNIGLR